MDSAFLSREELMQKIDDVCPEMKSNMYLMALAKRVFCGISNPKLKERPLTDKEYQVYRPLTYENLPYEELIHG